MTDANFWHYAVMATHWSTLVVCFGVLVLIGPATLHTIPIGSTERNVNLFPGNDSSANHQIPCKLQILRSIDEFPPDFFTENQRRHGAVVVHLFVTFYGFIMITLICHDYFIPSVFCICMGLGISSDVAGATFMAMATSTSELIVSVIATFITQSDLGVGTVVGSGVYNTLGVPACAGLAASRVFPIEKWPLLRDSGVYVTSLAVLATFAVDNVIVWYEAAIMTVMYFVYFFALFAQDKLAVTGKKLMSGCSFRPRISSVFKYIKKIFFKVIFWRKVTSDEHRNLIVHNGNEQTHKYESAKYRTPPMKPTTTIVCEPDQINARIEAPATTLWWTFCLPATVALSVTIPDCQTKRNRYPLTFVMSILWISAVTYVLSWMLTIFGDTFGINDVVMGIGVLAVGSSIPEAVSAIINAQNGEGSMSITGALGSNTMDVLLCLGAPWFVKTCVLPASLRGGPVVLETDSLFVSCACMIAAVVVLNAAAAVSGFVMHRPFGCACLVGLTVVVAALMVNGLNATANAAVVCGDAGLENGRGA